MKKVFVCRAVNRADGSTAAPVESFDTKEQAESVFYTRCSQAVAGVASGDELSDAVIMFDAYGFVIDHKGWSAPEPEPNEE